MPKIKIEKVVSFSSEDPVHIANNILSNDPAKKWKCHTPGEKSSNLVLQLEEPMLISNIDIGNEHSAYVEVLVTRSSSGEDFKVLLVMSSFMSPLEARQSTNVNKVRMFTRDQLSTPERDEKWDRVKIVCTQPFNRHVQYGLSFITFYTTGKEDEKTQVAHVGKFALRPDSPNNITIGSLFARKNELKDNKPLTAAAAIREASLSHESPSPKKIKLPQATHVRTHTNDNVTATNSSRSRDEIFYTKDEDKPKEKIDFIMEQKKLEKQNLDKDAADKKEKHKRDAENKATTSKGKEESTRKRTDDTRDKKEKNKNVGNKASSSDKVDSAKRKNENHSNTPNKKMKKQSKRAFNRLFSDVVVVISGIQNPERANMRDMALAMGGKYKGDWDHTCTHLICAFANTPKFNQVKGKGKIVTKNWIIDCHSKRKRIPWRRYALDKSDRGKDESEEEIIEGVSEPEDPPSGYDDNRDMKSGSDTEDEIERINVLQQLRSLNEEKTEQKLEKETNGHTSTDNVTTDASTSKIHAFDCDTEEEDMTIRVNGTCPPLPNFFQDKEFYIDNNLTLEEIKTLRRYITACNGTVKRSLADPVNYVITTEEWRSDLGDVPPPAIVIHPNFVYQCFNSKRLLSHDDFLL